MTAKKTQKDRRLRVEQLESRALLSASPGLSFLTWRMV